MKELLEKYWNELEHYKNGGKLAGRRWVIDPNDGDSSFTIWYEIDSCSTWMMEDLLTNPQDRLELIINDEYFTYRKALAEGKIIQINNSKPGTWIDIDTDKLANYNPSFLRIKPDEPKFKVGDFVRYAYSTPARALEINNINGNRYYFTNSEMSCLEHELEPWTPVKGEWCWLYDRASAKSTALAQFKEIDNGYFMAITDASWYFYEPFLNSRPSYLKDK